MKAKENKTNPIKTVLIIVIGFLIIYYFTKWEWAILVAIIIGLLGVFSNFLSKQIDFLWMKLAWVLSFIIPNILLTVIFYFLLFPLALLSKLFGNSNVMSLKNNMISNYTTTNKEYDKSSFEKTW